MVLASMEKEYCVYGSNPEMVVSVGTAPLPPSRSVTLSETRLSKLAIVLYNTITAVITECPSNPNVHERDIVVEEILVTTRFVTGSGGTITYRIQHTHIHTEL